MIQIEKILSPVKTSTLAVFIVCIAIGASISIIVYLAIGASISTLSWQNMLWTSVICGLCIAVGTSMLATIPINSRCPYKNVLKGTLVNGFLREGIYLLPFWIYRLEEPINSTKNKYELTVMVDTKDRIRGEMPITMWAWVLDPYKFKE